MAAQYDLPVHYEENGKWKDIDNSLSEQSAQDSKDVDGYANTDNPVKIKLAKHADSKKLVKIRQDQYQISWEYLAADNHNPARAMEVEPIDVLEVTTVDPKLVLNNLTSGISYDEIEPGVDLQYILSSTTLKENIVVKQKRDSYAFVLNLNVKQMTPELQEDGSIVFRNDEGESIFFIPAPFMTDADGAYSDAVIYTLEPGKKNKEYILTITADVDWMNDEERAYPVIIDPLVSTGSQDEVEDSAFVNSNDPDITSPFGNYDMVGTVSGGINRTFIRFMLPQLPIGSVPTNSIYFTYQPGKSVLSNDPCIEAHAVDYGDIWPYELTWNTQQDIFIDNDVLDIVPFKSFEQESDTQFNITKLIQKSYFENKLSNIGIMLKSSDETVNCSTGFEPYGYGNNYILVYYTRILGHDSRYDYHTVALPDKNILYINDITGTTSIQRHEMGFPGNIMPVSIDSWYTLSREGNYTWKTNYHQDIRYDSAAALYSYYDGEGVIHYFQYKSLLKSDSGQVIGQLWESLEPNTDIILTRMTTDTNRTNYTNINICREGQILSFDSYGRLVKISKDQASQLSEQSIQIIYDSYSAAACNNIEKIIDGTGREYRFEYELIQGVNRLSRIYFYGLPLEDGSMDPSLGTITEPKYYAQTAASGGIGFWETPNGTINYGVSNQAPYSMMSVTNYALDGIVLNYSGTRLTQVNQIYYSQYPEDQVTGDTLQIEYGINKTIYSSVMTGNQEIILFNNDLKKIGSYDQDGNPIYQSDSDGSLINTATRYDDKMENNLITNGEFSLNSASIITGWNTQSADVTRIEMTEDAPGGTTSGYALCIAPNYQASQSVVQIYQPEEGIPSETTFLLSGWIKSNALLQNFIDTPSISITVKGISKNGAASLINTMEFSAQTSSWQYQECYFQTQEDCIALHISLNSNYQANQIVFDRIALQEESFSALEATHPGQPSDEYENTYNSNGLLVSRLTEDGKGWLYSYDTYGNVLTETFQNQSDTESDNYLCKTQTFCYSDDGNYLVSVTDSLGNVQEFNFDSQTGMLMSYQDPNENTASIQYADNGNLTKIQQNNMSTEYTYHALRNLISQVNGKYNYSYDATHNLTGISVGTTSLVNISYSNMVRQLCSQISFGNGDKITYDYDSYNNITGITVDGETSPRYEFVYDNKNNLSIIQDHVNNTTIKITDDLTAVYSANDTTYSAPLHTYGTTMGTTDDSSVFKETIGSNNYITNYNYKTNTTSFDALGFVSYSKRVLMDSDFDRPKGESIYNGAFEIINHQYQYQTIDNKTIDRIESERFEFMGGSSLEYSYTYDGNGNITSITKDGQRIHEYMYDSNNRLSNWKDVTNNLTTSYTYDSNGNMTYKTQSRIMPEGWLSPLFQKNYWYINDQLTGLNDTGNYQYIPCDTMGNPQKSISGLNYTWEQGRQLASASKPGLEITYTYNSDGIRTSKTINGDTTTYTLANNQITSMTVDDDLVYFRYDKDGKRVGLEYQNSYYNYLYNIQGDVIGLSGIYGGLLYSYEYDPWGVLIGIYDANGNEITAEDHVAIVNPFRYRGYYYDTETGLYYLQSRYYDPAICRFVNADDPIMTKSQFNMPFSSNLFLYALDNPVNYSDLDGYTAVDNFFNSLTNIFGFGWDSDQQVFYGLNDSPQRIFGFCSLYDVLGEIVGLKLETMKYYFTYDGKRWRVQVWKGVYSEKANIIGGEVGLYIKSCGIGDEFAFYRCAEDHERLVMYYDLRVNGVLAFTRGPELHWWLSGFKVQKAKTSQLSMDIAITFKDNEMKEAFLDALDRSSLSVAGTNTVYFRF